MSSRELIDDGRRSFLKCSMLSIAAVPLATLIFQARAFAQGESLPHLDEADPVAASLGYKHDATQVTDPKRQDQQHCSNCQFYTGKPEEAWGPCSIFPGKAVNAKGWCATWTPRAG
jgi:hypothetical protein